VELHIPHLAETETQPLDQAVIVEATDPGAVLELRDLQQVQLLLITDNRVEKAAHF
jgi:hypothetical protein